ncbi:MAG: AMP-binding protein, partial [Ruminiclostridium sp.]
MLEKYTNLIDILSYISQNGSQGICYINGDTEEEFLLYRDLYQKAIRILNNLQNKGLKPGDELVFQIEDNQSFIAIFWSCLLGGIIPVPISVGNNDEHKRKLFKIWGILNNPYLITDNRVFKNLKTFAGTHDIESIENISVKALMIDQMMETTEVGKLHISNPTDIAFIQFSSGSAGEPKGVVLTHENLITNIKQIIHAAQVCDKDMVLGWMPLTHDMGMIGTHLVSCTANINHFIMPTALFIRRPTLWIKKLNEHKATLTSSPNFGYKYFISHFTEQIADGWDLSNVRLIFNGAEPINPNLCNEFLDKMEAYGLKKTTMFTVYGMAEACLAVSFPPVNEMFRTVLLDRNFLSIGQKVVSCLESKK